MVTTSNMKKFIGSIKRSSTTRTKSNEPAVTSTSLPQGDHPEAIVVREAYAFCEAGAPGSPAAGDEFLHLPAIVDAAESSPPAAKEVAQFIQRYLSKQNNNRGFAQYNAIMLMRILTDNPGPRFTQNFDKSFVSTVKSLLKESQDSSVQQIIRETLDYFEAEKLTTNDTLGPLIEMWRKEKGSGARMYSSGVSGRTHQSIMGLGAPRPPRETRPRGLPNPEELAARIEEAKTSARLLVQMVQSTPQNELSGNDLIKEFAERARQAHKSMQQFMAAENPAPDENTMLTLIETSEQLNIAMTKHQRAVLQARRANSGQGQSPNPQNQDPFSTTALQSALPPQAQQYQAPQQQHPSQQQYQQTPQQPYQQGNVYHNRHESEDMYKPISPVDQQYSAPSGLPPNVYQSNSNSNYAQTQVSEPISPPRTHERPNSATRENPFSDEASYAPPPGPPNSYGLFNRAAGNLQNERRNTTDLDNSYASTQPERPGAAPYNSGWQPTPSFVHRQESSTANINMSGVGSTPDRRI